MAKLFSCCTSKPAPRLEERIIIVGAGIAGLACGYRLKELGFQNVMILEAKDRVGGRVHCINIGSRPVEMGAQYIHGETNNIIYEISKYKNLVAEDQNKDKIDIGLPHLQKDEKEAILMLFNFLDGKLSELTENLPCSFGDYIYDLYKEFIAENNLGSMEVLLKESLDLFYNFQLEINGCLDLSTLSLNLLNNYRECDGCQTVMLKNGLSPIVRTLLDVIPSDWILTKKPVVKINWSDFRSKSGGNKCDEENSNFLKSCRSVKVICGDGEVLLADHVILTISLGCLKKFSHSLFVPPLSEKKTKAINSLGYGNINKIYLNFKEAFWEPEDKNFHVMWQEAYHKLFSDRESDFPQEWGVVNKRYWTQCITRFACLRNHPNVLCVWVVGYGSVIMETLDDDVIISDCMKLLQAVLKKQLPTPTEIYRTTWLTDPFFCGTYSYISVESEKENILPSHLAEPEYANETTSINPVLLFAGEATHDYYFSTVHGAYETGLREAQRLFNCRRHEDFVLKTEKSIESLCKIMSSSSINTVHSQENLRIIIIGAGIAGLVCALQLYNNNFTNVTILEAQNKVGGRVSTMNHGDYYLELGAQWLHGANNALCDFSKANKLLPHIIDENSYEGKGFFYTSSGKIIETGLVDDVKDVLNFAKEKLEEGCYETRKIRSVMDYLSEAFDKHLKTSNNKDADLKKNIFRWYTKFENVDNACDSLNDIAIQSFTEWEECPDDLYHIEYPKGFSSLVETLVSQIPKEKIVTNKAVKTVHWNSKLSYDFSDMLDLSKRSNDGSPVTIECEDGEKMNADCTIITASVGFLKENVNSFFSPPLPQNKRNALDKVGYGTVNKIFLIYDEVFWTMSDLGFQLVWEEEGLEKHELVAKYPWICGITGFDVMRKIPNVLLGWISGEDAKAMERCKENEVLHACHQLLQTFLKRTDLPKPVKLLRSTWFSNPYIRGSYSNRTLDYYKNDNYLHDLQHPLCSEFIASNNEDNQWPSVLFAGEALDEHSFSSAHGAFRSAVNTANLLMKVCSNLKAQGQENRNACGSSESESESEYSTNL